MELRSTIYRTAWVAVLALAAGAVHAQTTGRWACQVNGLGIDITLSGDTANVELSNGERFALKRNEDRRQPSYTDGRVALNMSGGDPTSSISPQWVRFGEQSTITRCLPIPLR